MESTTAKSKTWTAEKVKGTNTWACPTCGNGTTSKPTGPWDSCSDCTDW